MIIVMKPDATDKLTSKVKERVLKDGFKIHESRGVKHTIIGVIGDKQGLDTRLYGLLEGVYRVVRVSTPYKIASRSFKKENTVIEIDDIKIGGDNIVMMAGPCTIEDQDQMNESASNLKRIGCHLLRGGAFKPRTSPYSFQGHGESGLKIIKSAGEKYGLKIITEVTEVSQIPLVSEYTDIFQIGTRNMQNFAMLSQLGKVQKPVLLKRGMSATIDDLLLSAEYILSSGNQNVILCERGIRTFEPYTRNTLDISAIPAIKSLSHLPIIVDPSHSSGRREFVSPLSRAAIAAGADGILVEVHPDPDNSVCDAEQAITFGHYTELLSECRKIAETLNRTIITD